MSGPGSEEALPGLTAEERRVYEWQLWLEELGETGQRRLKNASVLVSRCGGVGGAVAYELAAAGVGKLVLAHGGNLKPSDLNRQLLMAHNWIGRPRVDCAAARLKDLNPRMNIAAVAENVGPNNAESLMAQADLVVDCAPLFEERFLMNQSACRQGKPMVECAMYAMEAQLTTFRPGITGCLRCLYPEAPPDWKRQFPVLGAVSGSIGCLAAMEAIKVITGLGKPLYNRLLHADTGTMEFRTVRIGPRPGCPECGGLRAEERRNHDAPPP